MSLRDAIMQEMDGRTGGSGRGGKAKKKPSDTNNGLEALFIQKTLDNLFTLRDHKDEDRAGLHASSIIVSENEFCYRSQVLSLLYKQNQGQNHPVDLLRIFAAGNSIHEKWQNLFMKGNIAIDIEARHFSEQYEMYYTPDAVVTINGRKYVVEIKSMNTFAYQKATSHPSGQKQLQLYMHMLGIPRGFVLPEDKNNQKWQPFIHKYDYEQVLPYLNRLAQVQELKKIFLETKEMPPRKCKNSTCKWAMSCHMRDACFNIGIGRKKIA